MSGTKVKNKVNSETTTKNELKELQAQLAQIQAQNEELKAKLEEKQKSDTKSTVKRFLTASQDTKHAKAFKQLLESPGLTSKEVEPSQAVGYFRSMLNVLYNNNYLSDTYNAKLKSMID